jgi:AsmA protein
VRSRALKWISLALGTIVGLVVIGVLVIIWLVDPNSFKSKIESAVRDATGRELALVGDIELGFFPWLSLKTGEGRFGNASGFGSDPMVSWQRAQLGAKLFPLLRGKLIADRVVLEGADVRLVKRADGAANWQGIGSQEPASKKDAGSQAMELRIGGVSIRDSRVSYIDESAPRRVEVTDLDLSTDGIEFGKPFTDTELSGVLHMEGFVPAGVPFRLAVPEAVLPEDFSAVDVANFTAALGGFEAEGAVSGTLGEQPKIAGRIESNAFDLRELLTSVGVAAPKTTDDQAMRKLQFKADWRFDAGAIALEPLALTLDDTHFNGFFRRGAGEHAVGEFELKGDRLDVARYIPPTDPNSPPFVLPTAMLKLLQFRGNVQLEQATLDDISMKGVTLRLLLDEKGLRQDVPAVPAPTKATP